MFFPQVNVLLIAGDYRDDWRRSRFKLRMCWKSRTYACCASMLSPGLIFCIFNPLSPFIMLTTCVLQWSNWCEVLIKSVTFSVIFWACMCFALQVWGRTLLLGLAEMDKKLSFNPLEILEGRKLKYVVFGGFKKSDIPRLVDKYMNNVISHSFSGPLPFFILLFS